MSIKSSIAFICVLFVSLLASGQLLHQGFEDAPEGLISNWEHVANWRIDDWAGSTARFSIVSESVNSGAKALEIEVLTASGTNPTEIYVANWAYPLTVPDKKILEVSFYARGSRNGQFVRLDIKNPGVWDNLASAEFSLSETYEKYSLKYNVYGSQEIGIYLNFAYQGGDTCWVDDIRFDIESMPEPPELDTIFKRSDVVFTGSQSQELVDIYQPDLIGWGWLPRPLIPAKLSAWREEVQNAQHAGSRYQARFEVDAGWKNMIDYDPDGFQDDIVTTLGGTRVVSPWFEGREYKDYPAYLFCTNASGFRDFLRFQVEEIVSGGVNSIMFDGQTGTPLSVRNHGGCFCSHCMEGFRDYMKENYSQEQLAGKGIGEIESFHYGSFLAARGWSEADYKGQSYKANPTIPLFDNFQEYQYDALSQLTSELSQYADLKAGRQVIFSTSSPPHRYTRSVLTGEVDHFTLELSQKASSLEVPFEPVLNYTLADALGKGLILNGSPQQDWSVMYQKDRPALIRSWIAQAYAYGACFMVPVRNWAGGYDYHVADPEHFEYMYDFIHNQADLFDGYELFSKVGLLLPYEGLRYGQKVADDAIRNLMKENIPFHLVISGSNWWDRELDEWDLKRSDALVLTSDVSHMLSGDRSLLNQYENRSAGSGDTTALFQILPRQVTVSAGNENVTVVPRENPDSPEFPYVVHLVNRMYNESTLSMDTLRSFSVNFSKSLFCREIIGASLFRPGGDSLELAVNEDDNGFSVDIPELVQWGVIRLKSRETKNITFRIYGQREGEEPYLLEHAEIRTKRHFQRTLSEGEVRMRQVPGEITYSLNKKGYGSEEGGFALVNDTLILDTLELLSYEVRVQVRDASSGEVLSNCLVSMDEYIGTSDDSGMISFSGLGYSKYTLEVSRDQYVPYRNEAVEISSDTLLKVSLSRNAYLVTFQLTDSISGGAIQGVGIEFNQQSRVTDQHGKVTISAPFGSWGYSIEKADYGRLEGSLSVESDTLIQVRILRIFARVTFRVKHNGSLVYQAAISLNGETKETNAVGMVGFVDVPAYMELDYLVSGEGLRETSGQLLLQGDTLVDLQMTGTAISRGLSPAIQPYPNPVAEELFISGLQPGTRLNLSDLMGRVFISIETEGSLERIGMEELVPGTYLLTVDQGYGSMQHLKIIKL